MTTRARATFAVRVCVDNRTGDSWTPITTTRTSIQGAAAWREGMRAWCQTHPLPPGFEYRIPLPRPIPS